MPGVYGWHVALEARQTTMKRLILITISLLLITGCAPQTTSGGRMAEANRRYEAGEFAEAAAAYQALIDAGVQDGTLYYNAGNAYFKAGDLGRAILNYRRAQRRLPRDPDVAANLQLARAQRRDRLEETDSNGLVGLVNRLLVEGTTVNETAAIALGLEILLAGLLVVAILWPRRRRALRYGIVAGAVLLILSTTLLGIRLLGERGRWPAVIVAESVEIHSGPGADYLTEFSLHAGAEVHVLEDRGGWTRITLPGDLQGWVQKEAVEEIEFHRQ